MTYPRREWARGRLEYANVLERGVRWYDSERTMEAWKAACSCGVQSGKRLEDMDSVSGRGDFGAERENVSRHFGKDFNFTLYPAVDHIENRQFGEGLVCIIRELIRMHRRTIPNVIMSTNYCATGRRVATARDSPGSAVISILAETSSSEASHVSFHGYQLRENLRKWLFPLDPPANSKTACAAHHEVSST